MQECHMEYYGKGAQHSYYYVACVLEVHILCHVGNNGTEMQRAKSSAPYLGEQVTVAQHSVAIVPCATA